MKRDSSGFSLLEMVVAVAIVAAMSAWTIPTYIRSLRQGEVDRYAQFIEAGFYDLRAELGTSRTSCLLQFDQTESWVSPKALLEFRQDDGTLANTDRLRCCNSQIHKAKGTEECEDGPKIGALLNPATASTGTISGSLRFIRLEGTPESKRVQVAVSRADYELTPPGTSARTEPITFMVRSIDANEDDSLRSRCVEVSGSGHLLSGTWEGSLSSGRCLTDGEASGPNP